ncbi:MAG: hypothetical protein U5K38_02875 [Woeseiaceae bacterium]|nr:hypothetical protein [Woeseiaceae bacterium]
MKNASFLLFTTILAISTNLRADGEQSTEERQITAVFDTLTHAWRSKDGQQWGERFLDDADFTVWFGLELKGKEEIQSGRCL